MRRVPGGPILLCAAALSVLSACRRWPWQDEPGPGADLRQRDLSELDLSGVDLHGANLTGADLEEARLDGANLTDARLDHAKLDRATLTGANLTRAHLAGASLRGAQLDAALLRLADVDDWDTSRLDLSQASLQGADLSRSHLIDVNLSGADLTGATFVGANLSGAELSDAKLINVDLSGASLRRVKGLGKARLENVKWRDTVCPNGEATSRLMPRCGEHEPLAAERKAEGPSPKRAPIPVETTPSDPRAAARFSACVTQCLDSLERCKRAFPITWQRQCIGVANEHLCHERCQPSGAPVEPR